MEGASEKKLIIPWLRPVNHRCREAMILRAWLEHVKSRPGRKRRLSQQLVQLSARTCEGAREPVALDAKA
jgi:hypothetical protein